MNRADKEAIVLAMSLAFLSGLVDAMGYLQLGGFFVSFMTGNSTRLGVDFARHDPSRVLVSAAVILLFISGVIAASLLRRLVRSRAYLIVLFFVTGLLAAAALAHGAAHDQLAVGFLTLAMGAENLIFVRNGEVTVSLTYMTGTLVKFAQRLADTFCGGSISEPLRHFFPWLGVVSGAIAGGVAYVNWGLTALWIGVAISGALTLVALTRGISERFTD